jgi:CBS domain-containing protein/SAM-dependent methyltransferase
MKVSDVMRKNVEYVNNSTSVKQVARVIFGRGINGVPVCKNKKVIGFITERDILSKFYPTMEEYVDDPFHSSDFEGMEKRVSEILDLNAEEIMSKNTTTVPSDAPLLEAQSLMFINKISRLPVVDEKGNLIGIISKGDIFKSVVGNSLSLEEEEGFYDWSAKIYDTMLDWKTRLANEIPELEVLFKKEGAKRILDVASSTGEHSIALANKEFEVFGIESSSLMHRQARLKRNKLSKEVQLKLNLFQGDYEESIKRIKNPVDAAIFMGNTLPHVQITDENILKHVLSVLRKENPVMVFQIINFNKIINRGGLRDFTLRDEKPGSYYKSHAFLGFYTKKDSQIIYTRAVLSSVGDGKWSFASVNSTPIQKITKLAITKILKKLGFSNISFYGNNFNGPLFKEQYSESKSDNLIVIAKK